MTEKEKIKRKYFGMVQYEFQNIAGMVKILRSLNNDIFKVNWKYKKPIHKEIKIRNVKKTIKMWSFHGQKTNTEFFSNLKDATNKFNEIQEDLLDKELLIKEEQYEIRLEEEKKLKVSKLVKMENMNLRLINYLHEFIGSKYCFKCGRTRMRLKIDPDTGDVFGHCCTCNEMITLGDILLNEKRIFQMHEEKKKLQDADMMKCPSCKELININAEKCDYCDKKFRR